MKTLKLTVLFLLIAFYLSTQAQVAINKDGSAPASTSILHVKGDNSGTPVQAMFINSETGNVGIGTTTPGFPLTFKQIGGEKISFYGQSGNHYGIGIGISMLQIHGSSSNSIIAFGYGSSASFTELMRIKGNGQVGIGTTEPDTDLHVYSNTDNNGLTLQTSDNTFMQGIRFRNSGGAYTWNIYRKNAGSNHADLIFANGMSTDLSTFTEVVTFKDGGNVGIGTTAPSNELSVVGDADFSGDVGIGTATPGFPLSFEDVGGDKISFHGQSGDHYGIGIATSTLQIHGNTSNSNITFGYGSSASFTELMRIKGNGQVGVGTSSPDASAALEVSSTTTGFLPPRLTTSQRDAITSPANGLTIYNTDNNDMEFYNGSRWRSFSPPNSDQVICGNQFIDYRDGQFYETVQIGSQCWMSENLNLGTMINATNGGTNNNGEQTDNSIFEKYCYGNNTSNCDTYGGLYQWNEMMQYVTTEGAQGICPDGWHLPTDDEWKTMEMHLGMTLAQANATGSRGTDEGGKMKETGIVHWNSPNTGAINSSGFTALSGGSRSGNGSFNYPGNYGYWWSSTEHSGTYAWYRRLDYNSKQVVREYYYKSNGFSIRCLKD